MPIIKRQEERTVTVAEQLVLVQQARAQLDEKETALKQELLSQLKKQGVRQVRLDDGTMYIRASRKSLVVKDATKARKWAEENNCLQLDKPKALKITRMLGMPKFFDTTETEYLSIRRSGDEKEES